MSNTDNTDSFCMLECSVAFDRSLKHAIFILQITYTGLFGPLSAVGAVSKGHT